MPEGPSYSNTVRAGAFLVTAVAAALAVTITLSKAAIFTAKSEYVVEFRMSEGVAGLDIGSEVRVSGLKVGRVMGIVQKFEEDRIDVTIQMDAGISIHKDAAVIRSQPLLGNYSWLNFSSLGTPGAGTLEAGARIEAKPSGGLLATIVGPQNAARANEMFTNLVAFTASLDDFARVQYPKHVIPVLENANTTLADLRTDYQAWRGDITTGLDDAAKAMKKLDGTLDDAQVAARDVREAVAHFREVNVKQLDDVLGSAQRGAERFAGAMDSLDTELVARIPDVRTMLADLRQASVQVKLATMEVRRSPWKLLYRPSGDELARENLYESARAFAIASSDMRVAGETLQAALRDAPKRFESDAKFRDALRDQVLASVDRYAAAQQRLFDVLKADFGEAPAAEQPAQGPMVLPAKDPPAH